MVREMDRHRAAIIGDQDEIVGFAPSEDLGIESAEWRHTRIAHAPDDEFGCALPQAGEQSHINMLIEEMAQHHAGSASAIDSAP